MTDWRADIIAVYEERMDLGRFLHKHDRLVRHFARTWSQSGERGAGVSQDDIVQEVRLAICLGLKKFKPKYGAPLHWYIKRQVNWHLSRYARGLVRLRQRDLKFYEQQIVEERVLVVSHDVEPGDNGRLWRATTYSLGEYATLPDSHVAVEVMNIGRLVVGSLRSDDARVIAAFLRGDDPALEVLRMRPGCKRVRKKVLRAFASATAAVKRYDPLTKPKETDTHAPRSEKQEARLRPIRKARPYADQREQGVAVSQ